MGVVGVQPATGGLGEVHFSSNHVLVPRDEHG